MGTPADAALAGGGNAPPPPNGGAPPAPNTGAPPPPNAGQFWAGWDKPEQADTRTWVQNKNYADVFTLAKTAQGLEKEAATIRAGVKGYPTAGQDGKVDANAVTAWRTLVGVPESADKYDIPVPENNPYPNFKTYMAEELLAAHVPAAMAPLLAKGYEKAVTRMETELRAQEETASTQGLEQIKNSWGAQYQERMAIANRAKAWIAKEAGGLNEIQLRTLESVLGTPQWLTMLYKFGEGNRESVFAGDGGSPPSFQGGATEAQARIDQLTADRSAGKITQGQWAEITKQGGEYDQLIQRIAAGHA